MGQLLSADLDANYASVLNLFLELGYKSLYRPWTDETRQTAAKYLLDKNLAEEGAMDEFMDVFNKRLREEGIRRIEEEKTKLKAFV